MSLHLVCFSYLTIPPAEQITKLTMSHARQDDTDAEWLDVQRYIVRQLRHLAEELQDTEDDASMAQRFLQVTHQAVTQELKTLQPPKSIAQALFVDGDLTKPRPHISQVDQERCVEIIEACAGEDWKAALTLLCDKHIKFQMIRFGRGAQGPEPARL